MSQTADKPNRRFGGAPAVRAGAALVLGLSTLVVWWTRPPAQRPAPEPAQGAAPAPLAPAPGVDPVVWFEGNVDPLIERARERNRAAAREAAALLEERFDAHRAGVRPFVEEVTSWSARFSMARRMPADWWDGLFGGAGEAGGDKRSRVERFVMGRFRAHVMDERSLEIAVTEVVQGLAADLEASRNLLWTEIELAMREADAPIGAPVADFGAFQREADVRAAAMASKWAGDSLVNGVAAFAASAAGGVLAEQAAAALLSRIGVAAASAGASTAAGALAGGSAGGRGGGGGAGGGGVCGGVGGGVGPGGGVRGGGG
ncbi:MAG: hypothetical protein IBJ10_11370, partial [Phycisphaerales bacterium]|nr:hypothetical protein [Phycisphaerales bacterium]